MTTEGGPHHAFLTLTARLTELQAEGQRLLEHSSSQALEVVQDALALATQLNDAHAVARTQVLLAQAYMQASELHTALQVALTASYAFTQLQDELGQADAELLAGRINLSQGTFEIAEGHLLCAISVAQRLASPSGQALHATALNQLAGVKYNQGAAKDALLHLETALGIWRTLENIKGQAHCLTNIGNIQNSLGQYHAAIETLSTAYNLYKTGLQDKRSEGFILTSLARLHSLNQDQLLAVEVAQAALKAAEASQDGVLTSVCLVNLGTFYLEAGQAPASEQCLMQALLKSREVGARTSELSALDSLGLLYQKTNRPADASQAHTQALQLALDLDYPQGELDARLHLGEIELTLQHLHHAEVHLTRALTLAVSNDSPKDEAQAHCLLARLAEQQADYRGAYTHGQEQLRLQAALFNVERDRQTRNLSIQFEVERAQHDVEIYRIRTEVEQQGRLAAEQQVEARTKDLARAQLEVVTRLAIAAEYRDDTTGDHTRRVGHLTAQIASALGWSKERAHLLGIAARLHDVGKIGIPDSVLLKAGTLTEEEFEQMKTHTRIGARILSGGHSELLQLAEEIALTHHERWDGSGYPRGLHTTQIPLSGRIVATADVFDALTQSRPYKRAWTAEEALTELRQAAGTHFDPLVVETANHVLSSLQTNGVQEVHSGLGEDLLLPEEATSQILTMFGQLLEERTRSEADAAISGRQHPDNTAG
ncbi:HD domain-containing phosphohydrolase [Deinococcus ruber]|uniref:HD-GYP domain-containing protein n=1 Tax=Deinococcus ruber TaxID=1848197 RepID=A0A918CFV8_9DEIO|nr:HD domain-containing phosphohydrolase [Deinococcus ruber]GGR19282.1 hypothetical protein GCM10008957_34740 [Deinococcus ruber]